MVKVAILNYLEETITIITISEELLKHYDSDIEVCLIENAKNYNTRDCHWMKLGVDKFGNFDVMSEVLETVKNA